MSKAARVVSIAFSILVVLFTSGCGVSTASVGSSVKEVAFAAIEPPSIEKQINRVATASAIIKSNQFILKKMPISVDATWMDEITSDITDEQEKRILNKLKQDPYFGTVILTNVQQGIPGALMGVLSPLEKSLYQRVDTFFSQYPNNIYALTADTNKLLNFQGGATKPVKALRSDRYANLEAAIISMIPTNMQKDLQKAIKEYEKSTDAVLKKKELIGKLTKDEASKKQNEEKIAVAEHEIKELEKVVDEKEKIMDEQWKLSTASIDTGINDKKIALASKIQKVLTAMNDGAVQAGVLYVAATAKAYTAIGQIKEEIGRLGIATAASPKLMTKRIARLKDNALMLVPNIAVGAYLIVKQQIFISKYSDVIDKVVSVGKDKEKLAKN
jgi:hypothetical protein